MTGVVFFNTLRRNLRSTLLWAVGMAFLGGYIALFIGDVDALEQMRQLVETLPPVLLQMVGMSDVQALSTPEGFIVFGFFGRALLFLCAYAVIAGMSVSANEEDSGILDIVLSLPLARARFLLEKLLAFTLMTLLIVFVSLLGIVIGVQLSGQQVNMTPILESSIMMLPGLLLVTAFTAFSGVLLRRRTAALAIAAVFVVGSYFSDFIGSAASDTFASSLSSLSFFSYVDPEQVLATGLNAGNLLLLLTITGVLVTGAVWLFNRRDIGV